MSFTGGNLTNCTILGNNHKISGDYIVNYLFEQIQDSKIYDLSLEFDQILCLNEKDLSQKNCLQYIKNVSSSELYNMHVKINRGNYIDAPKDEKIAFIQNMYGTSKVINCLVEFYNTTIINNYTMIFIKQYSGTYDQSGSILSQIENNTYYIQGDLRNIQVSAFTQKFEMAMYPTNKQNYIIFDIQNQANVPQYNESTGTGLSSITVSSQTSDLSVLYQGSITLNSGNSTVNPNELQIGEGNTSQAYQYGLLNLTRNFNLAVCEEVLIDSSICKEEEEQKPEEEEEDPVTPQPEPEPSTNNNKKSKVAIYVCVPIIVILVIVIIVLIYLYVNKDVQKPKQQQKQQEQVKQKRVKKTRTHKTEIQMEPQQQDSVEQDQQEQQEQQSQNYVQDNELGGYQQQDSDTDEILGQAAL